jgi:SAM-dependent methyltransferase
MREEAAFADAEYSTLYAGPEVNPSMFAKYKVPGAMWDIRQRAASLLGDVSGKSVLDYGCGQGEEATYLALLGARVTAIDISEVGIRLTRLRAVHNGVADRVDARLMNATPTSFAANSFDLVHGLGILHHVGVHAGLSEVHRVLKPGGRGVFIEPMGNSPTVEAAKRFLASVLPKRFNIRPVTNDEENLKLNEVADACVQFRASELYPFHLLYRVRKLLLPERLHDRAKVFDHHLLRRFPPLKHLAGALVVAVTK